VLKALVASSCCVVQIFGGVLDYCSFSLLSSSSTLLIISSSVMIWRFSSLPASQLLISAIVVPDEPFSHGSAILGDHKLGLYHHFPILLALWAHCYQRIMDVKATTFSKNKLLFRRYILPCMCKIKNYVFEVCSFQILKDFGLLHCIEVFFFNVTSQTE
jgi:hypothetical protein